MDPEMTAIVDTLPAIQPQLQWLSSGKEPDFVRRFMCTYRKVVYDAHINTSQRWNVFKCSSFSVEWRTLLQRTNILAAANTSRQVPFIAVRGAQQIKFAKRIAEFGYMSTGIIEGIRVVRVESWPSLCTHLLWAGLPLNGPSSLIRSLSKISC